MGHIHLCPMRPSLSFQGRGNETAFIISGFISCFDFWQTPLMISHADETMLEALIVNF